MFNWWVDFYAEIIQNKMKQKTLFLCGRAQRFVGVVGLVFRKQKEEITHLT